MPSALVTGGGGFIGSNLARLLLEVGYDVTVLDNFLSGYRENLDELPGARIVEGDVRDPVAVDATVAGADVVFHLAASVGNTRSIEQPLDDAEINLLGTLHVLEAARRHGVGKLVFSSSAGIFGELTRLPISEDHPAEPTSPYGVSKLAAEKVCLVYARLYDLDAVCLRYFNVYGPNQRYDAYGNVIPIFAHRLVRGEKLTIYDDGEQTRDFVNVRDVATANLLAARAEGLSGVFNIASASSVSINRLVELMAASSGLDARVEHAPPRPGDVRDSLADISAAARALGYRPDVELEAGLAEYLDWVRAGAVSSV
jgi:UDP-glucose 4-epimerase